MHYEAAGYSCRFSCIPKTARQEIGFPKRLMPKDVQRETPFAKIKSAVG